MTGIVERPLDILRARSAGEVLGDGDPGYDSARSLWNGIIDRRPAAIARCRTAEDVRAAVTAGRECGLEIAVRGGGHSFSGSSSCDGGLMIDLSQMSGVAVDPAERRARCGGGATWADVDGATQEFGLATPGGVISHTGIGGLTLGGGMGWLTRHAGLALDNLVSAEVVTADGRIVRASAAENPDLFWALRGGGGNFGVVTEFEYRLRPVGPEVHVGFLFWESGRAAAALQLCRDVLSNLPEGISALLGAGLSAPPMPFVPPEHFFAPGNALILAGFGSASDHLQAVDIVRAALPPLFDHVTPMPYTQLQRILDDSAPWGVNAYEKALYLDDLNESVIDTIVEFTRRKKSPMSFAPTFRLDGAFTDPSDDDTAFGGPRNPCYVFNISAVTPEPLQFPAERAWVRDFWSALRPHASSSGSYVNFMSEYDDDRLRATFGADKYDRLAAVKAAYDPDNIFHLNPNIKPK
ncbi:MAG TPA: FAD-binding oxidoreductase [Mycobacteriales bacterium]|nr:FAD-binding oxidoreductase [Mycobacteriales bacterium]